MPRLDAVQDILQLLSDLLADAGLRVSPRVIGFVLVALAAVIAVRLAIGVVKTSAAVVESIVDYSRKQVREKFWRDSGKLATLISLVLLVVAYGLYDREQPVVLGEALARLVRERLLEILPLAILTQTVLLCAFWLIYGAVFRVPRKVLGDPFKNLLMFLAGVAVLSTGSIGIFLVVGDDPEAALTVLWLTILVCPLFLLVAARFLKRRQATGAGLALMIALPMLMLLALIGSLFAAIYTAISDAPTVTGLLGFIAIALAVMMLIACYRFRAYIGNAEVPAATGYFIDFSLAVSAVAVALAGQAQAQVSLGGVPTWAVAVVPALLVAAAVFVFNLLRLRSSTPRWALCLLVALIAGLLAGPAKAVLTPVLEPLAQLVPVPGAVDG